MTSTKLKCSRWYHGAFFVPAHVGVYEVLEKRTFKVGGEAYFQTHVHSYFQYWDGTQWWARTNISPAYAEVLYQRGLRTNNPAPFFRGLKHAYR